MIRVAGTGDAPGIAEIYAPIVVETAISFEELPPSAAEIADRVAATLARYPWLVDDRDGRVAGYVYASRHRSRAAYRWSVDVTAYVHAAHRGRGVGGALYRALFRLLAAQGYHAAFAGITLPNDASVALHRAVGFEPIGVYREVGWKHGAWHDTAWYRRPLGEAVASPGEPIPFPRLDAALVRRLLDAP